MRLDHTSHAEDQTLTAAEDEGGMAAQAAKIAERLDTELTERTKELEESNKQLNEWREQFEDAAEELSKQTEELERIKAQHAAKLEGGAA